MSERSSLRLVVLGVLLLSLVLTMIARLFFLQVVAADVYTRKASDNNVRDVVTPAVRGLILDQQGRPLVANRTSLVVSVDRTMIGKQPDDGKAVLTKLAKALGTTYTAVFDKLQICGTKGAKKAPVCWNGSPFQPIPVAKDVSTDLALQIMEKRAEYPGVQAQLEAVREYPTPFGVNAAHMLGYLGPVSDDELSQQNAARAAGSGATASELGRTDLVGRAGLESEYDTDLRGTPGITSLAVDISANVTGTISRTEPTPGRYVVTNIDAKLQKVVEDQLLAAILRGRSLSPKGSSEKYRADSGAAVVIDTTNGHVLAMASYPTYDSSIWVGGIKKTEYEALTSPKANLPLISRAIQGLFAPASTFKLATTAAALMNGYSQSQTYPCDASFKAGTQVFRNNESRAYGNIDLKRAVEVSCDTIYYKIAYEMWLRDGGSNPKSNPADAIEKMAKAFGMGNRTGVDLPSEAAGRVGGRDFKQNFYDQYHDIWCKRQYDTSRSKYLRALDAENCVDGDKFRGGDAANAAVGQGDTIVTPLQMAVAYSALANGGTVWQPQVARAIIDADGKVVRTIKAKKVGKIPVSKNVVAYLQDAFAGVTVNGTGKAPFAGFPLAQIPVAAKTGTGQAGVGKQPTSWFASYAPANKPRYAVVMMVSQGGTGSGTSGPSVRKIYDSLFGITGKTIDPTKSVLVGDAPNAKLPTIGKDGTPVYPEAPKSVALSNPLPPSSGPSPSPATSLVVGPFLAALLLVGRRRSTRGALRRAWRGSP